LRTGGLDRGLERSALVFAELGCENIVDDLERDLGAFVDDESAFANVRTDDHE